MEKEKESVSLSKISRRDALKYIAISPVAAGMLASASASSSLQAQSDAKGRVVIVGGGAGAIMVLSRLQRTLPHADITIIAPNETHLYQPGQIFIAAGEYSFEDIVLENRAYIDEGVRWIKDEVARFMPQENAVTTRSGERVEYDYLVVATGIVYRYEWIKGLRAEDIGKNGISSVYLNDLEKGSAQGAIDTRKWFENIHADTKAGKEPHVLCTQPNTPIKCGGAPQKILYLCDDYLRRDGLSTRFTFATNGAKLFGIPSIEASLQATQKSYGNITDKFGHNLVAVDIAKKEATFLHTYEVRGEYDEDLEEYDTIEKKEEVTIAYDYLHVVPPMSPPDAVVNSDLGWQKGSAKGWLEVDRETLQHRRYENIFGIGDVCGIPIGKTGGSARHQAPIVVENLLRVMEGKKVRAKFDGYTVCPLKTRYGKIVMAEFNYEGLAPTIPFMNPANESALWWIFDLYMLKPMYKYLMLNGYM